MKRLYFHDFCKPPVSDIINTRFVQLWSIAAFSDECIYLDTPKLLVTLLDKFRISGLKHFQLEINVNAGNLLFFEKTIRSRTLLPFLRKSRQIDICNCYLICPSIDIFTYMSKLKKLNRNDTVTWKKPTPSQRFITTFTFGVMEFLFAPALQARLWI